MSALKNHRKCKRSEIHGFSSLPGNSRYSYFHENTFLGSLLVELNAQKTMVKLLSLYERLVWKYRWVTHSRHNCKSVQCYFNTGCSQSKNDPTIVFSALSSARNDPKNVFLWKYENHEFPGKTGETADFRSSAFSMIFKRAQRKRGISSLNSVFQGLSNELCTMLKWVSKPKLFPC